MRNSMTIAVLVATLWTSVGCIHLTDAERRTLDECEQRGVSIPRETVAEPALAGILNLAPGVGNFYLAGASGVASQWGWGTVNFLLWPLSVLWAVPEAAVDASTINRRDTAQYYMNPAGHSIPSE